MKLWKYAQWLQDLFLEDGVDNEMDNGKILLIFMINCKRMDLMQQGNKLKISLLVWGS